MHQTENTIDLESPSSWQDTTNQAVDDDDDYYATTVNNNVDEIQSLLHSLPRNLHKDKYAAKAEATSTGPLSTKDNRGPLGSLQEERIEHEEVGEGEAPQDSDGGLSNAWQYDLAVQRERQGHSTTTKSRSATGDSDVFCHSYDLQGRFTDQVEDVVGLACLPVIPSACFDYQHGAQHSGFAYFCELLKQLKPLVSGNTRKVVVRLLIYHHRDPASLAVALPLLLAHIRTHQWPVVLMIATQTWTTPASPRQQQQASLHLLRRTSDVVLATEGFAARREYPPPPEFGLFQGLLHVHKVSTVTAATSLGHFADATVSKRPAANLWGLKRDRRKLHIELLHIPPEDFAEGGGSAGGERSGAGRAAHRGGGGLGCASSGGGSSALDF